MITNIVFGMFEVSDTTDMLRIRDHHIGNCCGPSGGPGGAGEKLTPVLRASEGFPEMHGRLGPGGLLDLALLQLSLRLVSFIWSGILNRIPTRYNLTYIEPGIGHSP